MISKKAYFLLFFLTSIFVNNGFSQSNNCDCKADLTFLDAKIKKTPAYKNNKDAYDAALVKITNQAEKTLTIYDCYALLNSLLLSLNDNHSRVYGTDEGAVDEVKRDSVKYSAFKASAIYKAYPVVKMNLDSLSTLLEAKDIADVEGIYSIEDRMTIGFYKDTIQNQFKAVVLASEIDLWKRGEVIYTCMAFGDNYYLSIGGSLSSKRLIAYTERIDNGIFHYMGFTKHEGIINYATELPTDKTYFRDEISAAITYLRIGSFSGWNPTLGEAEKFYEQLAGTLNKPNIILDLRNNGGGGDRNSNILYKILKSYAKSNKIYVLINHRTVSNAEQFALKLSEMSNCIVLGQQSNGAIAYEIVDGNYELPSGHFIAVLTSKVHPKYLAAESKGVMPKIQLGLASDWIAQTVELMEEK